MRHLTRPHSLPSLPTCTSLVTVSAVSSLWVTVACSYAAGRFGTGASFICRGRDAVGAIPRVPMPSWALFLPPSSLQPRFPRRGGDEAGDRGRALLTAEAPPPDHNARCPRSLPAAPWRDRRGGVATRHRSWTPPTPTPPTNAARAATPGWCEMLQWCGALRHHHGYFRHTPAKTSPGVKARLATLDSEATTCTLSFSHQGGSESH